MALWGILPALWALAEAKRCNQDKCIKNQKGRLLQIRKQIETGEEKR